MAMLSFGGIDVSKDRLDVMVLPEEQCSSVPNNAAGWAKLVEQLHSFLISAIGIEASGGYERGAVRALLATGSITYCLIGRMLRNPKVPPLSLALVLGGVAVLAMHSATPAPADWAWPTLAVPEMSSQ